MGRRKQFCPQKTGMLEAFENNTKSKTEDDEEGDDDSNHHNKIKEEDEEEEEQAPPSPTLDSLKRTLEEEKDQMREKNRVKPPPSPNGLLSPFGVSSNSDIASTLLAAQQTLLHPAALLSLNPSSLYAVQLAQLQAAQILSQPPLKRKLLEQEDSTSPLDLSGPSSKIGVEQQQQQQHHHPLHSHHTLQEVQAMQIHASLPSPPKRPSFDSSSPLDKMNDMSKGKPRHSAWQSQWINRGEENAKDIFKCTWCKECFHSFQALTHHMKETKHFGGSAPPPSSPSPLKNSSSPSLSSGNSITTLPQISPPKSIPPTTPSSSVSAPPPPSESFELNSSSGPKKRDILKEQLPIPRKLVRGQDVWLGKGEEQTRNILKCMWCGESFRSLEVMTKHMQETKHYTKVISQDQISSWKCNNQVSNGSSSSSVPPAATSPSKDNKDQPMNSILSCKVCETSFQTLKDLSDHMIKNNHCINSPKSPLKNPSPPASVTSVSNNNNFTFPPKEKRKKSLPVKKLLELERSYEKGTTMKFPCDKCGISFPFHLFAEHIRNCTGSISRASSSPEHKRSESLSPPTITTAAPLITNTMQSRVEIRKSHDGGDCNILGSLEEMVSGNFKGCPRDDVVIPVIKEGQDEDIAVDEEEQVVPPHIKSSPSLVKSKENTNSNKNPLEALQMLCDKNEKQTQNFYGGGTSCGINPQMLGSSSPTDSMTFPWSPSPEALFKCPFCETPFVSKGAYRNHLSKMHFVKDPSVMMMMDPASIMALAAGIPSGFFPHPSGSNVGLSGIQPPPVSTSPDFEENSTSKFEKYSQLAKQLSNQRKPLSSPA